MTVKVQVTRIRISYIAACVHDRLQEIRDPVAFEGLLANPRPVRGLPLELPFGDDLPVDTGFWSRIAEMPLGATVPEGKAVKLRQAGVPLRYQGKLAVTDEIGRARGLKIPRLEAHLHPYGVAVLATVDLVWDKDKPETLGDQAARRVQEISSVTADIEIGGQRTTTTLGQAATAAAGSVAGLLTAGAGARTWDIPPHRLVTVIDGTISDPPDRMPSAKSPLHLILHSLSADADVLGIPKPDDAFVSQWVGLGYGWPPANLVYMLKSGTAVLSAEMAIPKDGQAEMRTADRHRRLSLQVAYITARSGLVHAARDQPSAYFREWAKKAADGLGRLYGPWWGYEEWGLVPRVFMRRSGVSADVNAILGKPLKPNEDYEEYPYE